MASTIGQLERLVKGREVQFRAVAITALCSYFLQLNGILLHWHLWAIALATIIPWIPLFTMKVLWTSKHYGFMAVYLVIMLLQAGHVTEHVVQMGQFIFFYNPAAKCFGWSWQGGCPLAHGIFGELDRELVHFVWDGIVLIACIVVRIRFRKSKNIWLTLAIVAASIHQVEHIFLFFSDRLYPQFYAHGGLFLGVQVKNAQAGFMGHNGVIGSAFPAVNAFLPGRINLHFIYNVIVIIPMILAFLKQTQHIYDEWFAKAMPQLSEEQLIAATAQAENVKFAAGQIIFRQGDPADKFYIITKGQVDVLRADKKNGPETQVARLGEGQYFGEIGLLGRTERTATVKAVTLVECLALSREVFKSLMVASSEAYKEMDIVLRRRIIQLGALQGLAVKDSVNADPDTVLKTRMIRSRLQMIQGDELSRILGTRSGSVPVPPAPVRPQAQPSGTAVSVVERPVSPVGPANNGFHRGALIVRSGPSAGMRFDINAPRILIGRRSTIATTEAPLMMIDDGRVSRQHVEIVAQPDGLYIRDMGSANGTWLNGRQLSGQLVRLEDGAEILVGTDSLLNYRVN